VKSLQEVARGGGGVLVSASDNACELLVRERARIPVALRSFEAPDSRHLQLMDKASLYALAERLGVPHPVTHLIGTPADIETVQRAAAYPCVLKPALSHRWRRLFGDRRVVFVRDRRELRAAAQQAVEAGLALLVSDYIPGPVGNIETAVMIRRADGSFPLAYTKHKLRQYPDLGAGTLHETMPAPDTLELARRLLEGADFVGLASVEAKRHERTGEAVLVEVNVRLPQGFGLGDAAGLDASWRLYAALAEAPLGAQAQQRQGIRLVVATLELPAARELLLTRKLGLRRLLASYRGVRAVSGLEARDPRLLLAFAGHQLRHLLRGLMGRVRAMRHAAGGS